MDLESHDFLKWTEGSAHCNVSVGTEDMLLPMHRAGFLAIALI